MDSTILGAIIGAVLPSILMLIQTLMAKRQNKANNQFREIQEENFKLREEARVIELEERTTLDNKIQTDIASLSKEVSALRHELDVKSITDDLRQLKVLNQYNFDYIQSLSCVVVTLGDTIAATASKDSDNTDAIHRMQKTIDNHKERETQLINNLYKVIS